MVTINQIKSVNLINVNAGILKANSTGFYLHIPVYPKFRNKHILNIYNNKNAPVNFYDNLKSSISENKSVKFYKVSNYTVNLNKDYFVRKFEDFNYHIDYPDVYDKLLNEDLKTAIHYMTSLNDNNLPMFVLSHNF